MRDSREIMRQQQFAIRREMDRRGILLKQVQYDSGLSYDTVHSYFPLEGGCREPAVIPSAVIYLFLKTQALPSDLLSLLLPAEWVLVKVPDEIDHETVCEELQSYLTDKARFHRVDSEDGPALSDNERGHLDRKVASIGRGK